MIGMSNTRAILEFMARNNNGATGPQTYEYLVDRFPDSNLDREVISTTCSVMKRKGLLRIDDHGQPCECCGYHIKRYHITEAGRIYLANK